MGAATYLLLGSLCQVLLSTTAAAQEVLPNSPLGCKLTENGPNQLQVAAFRAQLSDPKALKDFFSYQYSADLISDGLSNRTDSVYILPVPRFIVTPNVVEDVVAAVQFAADHGLKVQARGTGHQLAGIALPECGVTIDMRNFQDSSLDETTGLVTVQTGLRTGDAVERLVSKGRLPSVGTCKDVGVGGFALQGGLGWITRYRGAASDFIQSLDVVVVGSDKKAVRKTITANSDPDLFFAFRGAGGSYGVALAYTTATFPIPTNVQLAFYSITIDKAVEVLQWFAEFTATAPKSIYPGATLLPAGSDPDTPGGGAYILLQAYNLGPQTAQTEAAFQQLANFAAPRAYSNSQPGELYTEEDYLSFQTRPKECSNYTAATYWNTYFTANGTSLNPNGLSLDFINAMIAQIKASPYATPSITLLPSASIPTGPDATYFIPSAWSFYDSYYVFVGDTWNVPADDSGHIDWVKTASAALRPYYVGNYINQVMFEVADDSSRSYEASIFARLQTIKAQYDPNNLFRDLNYVHPNVKKPIVLDGGILNSLAFAAADAMAPNAMAPNAMAPAISGAEAPYPMQGIGFQRGIPAA
ncbi:probable xylooligosaccharide oxidase at N-terminal half [Coccomyxa sp. Obi]|nr:probable xylooligosaccharide oxidase at N-terminal half [Coccomyxa sp. Obi]